MSDHHSLEPPVWVDTGPAYRAMLDHLRSEPALAIDTESNSLYVYREQLCLIQISTPSADYLVDSLRLRDLSDLGPMLEDPAVLKVLHGADYDLSVLHRDFGLTLTNLFDTMWASRILGWPAHGLAALLKTHFGVTVNKKYQRANWGLRPLPPEQLDYARLDTHFLLPLSAIQMDGLEATGRWPQARHRFHELEKTRWTPREFDPDDFWRISGARDLDDRGRGVLRELFLFRDRRSRAANRPPFKVLGNRAMLNLSQERPTDIVTLRHMKGLSSALVRRHGRELLSAIQRGQAHPLPWKDRPPNRTNAHHPSNGRRSAACQARFEALRAWRNTTAEARGVEPDIVLTNHSLWAVAHNEPRRREDLLRGCSLARWEVDEFGDDLLAVVKRARARR